MDEHTAETPQTGAYDRREVLKRGAFVVGAATLWATPVVQTLGMRAAAAGTGDDPDPTGILCPPESEQSAQPRDLVFRWNGAGGATTALIVIQRPGSGRLCVVVGVGGLFTVAGQAGSNWRVGVYDPADVPSLSGSANRWNELPKGGTVLDASEFHTSCSAPLSLGDSFGTLTLVAGTPPGSGQSPQVLSGVSLAGVQVATSDCAAITTAEQPEVEEAEPEVDEVEPEAEQPEPEKSPENKELKAEAVEVEETVDSAEVSTKKPEGPSGDSDGTDGGDADALS